MATTTKSGRTARGNAWVSAFLILGILVLVNVLGVWVFGRLDLTDTGRYSLSPVSREAARAIDPVEVQVFISEDLPATISGGYGQERDIRGVAREFTDRLQEYQSYSGGRLRVVLVRDDIENKARDARLELFTGKQAEVEDGRLEFRKYALGATFQYRNHMEVFPLALEPEFFEFEITRILLRLKEKEEKSRGMEDVLAAGAGLADAARACHDRIEAFRKSGKDADGLSALVGGGGFFQAFRSGVAEWKQLCDPLTGVLSRIEPMRSRNELLDSLATTGRSFVDTVDLMAALGSDSQADNSELATAADRLEQLWALLEQDHENLKNSPGRKSIGFLCGHREFCPFADPKPFMRPELLQVMGQSNPLVQQFAMQAKQIEDQINLINEQLRKGLFSRRGLSVVRIGPGEKIPDDVEVLLVYGAERHLPDRDLYRIDQFLLSGRSVLVFLNPWEVSVYNFRATADGLGQDAMTMDELRRQAHPTNLDDFLAHHGVRPVRNLVIEPRSHDAITLIQLQKQGQYTIQSQRQFPYPLLPTFTDLDSSHALVRRLPGITLPYAQTLEVTDEVRSRQGVEVVELIRSSPESIATSEDVPLSPPDLFAALAGMKANGPRTVAVTLKGEFKSFFAGRGIPPEEAVDGQEPPATPSASPMRETGRGRLLVVGSNLGLENLSTDKIFDGFTMGQLTSGRADFFLKLRDYIANFQNWQLRLSQIAPVVQANLDFLYNTLDWGVQNEALADIRSKGWVRRPLSTLSAGSQTAVTLGFIVGLPLLFVLVGGLRFAARRRG
jgi:hypothetical protein